MESIRLSPYKFLESSPDRQLSMKTWYMIVQDSVGLFYGARGPSDKPLSHYIDDSPVPELDHEKVQTEVAYSQSKCPC